MDDQLFPERIKKAFDFASETTKQLLTLSTGILALTITFAKDILVSFPSSSKSYLMMAWAIYVVSLFFGLVTFSALTAELQPRPRKTATADDDLTSPPTRLMSPPDSPTNQELAMPSIWAHSIIWPSIIQLLTFLLATGFVVISGVISIRNSTQSPPTPPGAQLTETIRSGQRELFEALLQKNVFALGGLYADDFLFTDEVGERHDKAQTISEIARGDRHYQQLNVSDADVRVFGDMAVVSGIMTMVAKHKLKDVTGKSRFTLLFVNRDKRWQILTMEISPIRS